MKFTTKDNPDEEVVELEMVNSKHGVRIRGNRPGSLAKWDILEFRDGGVVLFSGIPSTAFKGMDLTDIGRIKVKY